MGELGAPLLRTPGSVIGMRPQTAVLKMAVLQQGNYPSAKCFRPSEGPSFALRGFYFAFPTRERPDCEVSFPPIPKLDIDETHLFSIICDAVVRFPLSLLCGKRDDSMLTTESSAPRDDSSHAGANFDERRSAQSFEDG